MSTRAQRGLLVAAALIALAFVFVLRATIEEPRPTTIPSTAPDVTSTTTHATPAPAPTHVVTSDPVVPTSNPSPSKSSALVGRVRGRADAAVAGARVEAWTDDGAKSISLGSATCDAAGAYRLDLARWNQLTPQARTLASIVARASANGWQPQTLRRPIGVDGITGSIVELAFDFRLERGQRVIGRVVDARGRAVARALVKLCAPRETEDAPLVAVAPDVTTSADGSFEIGFASTGTYALYASATGAGTALREQLELDNTGDRHLGDIVLAGTGELAGHVRDASGDPVASLEICAVPEELARDSAPAARAAILAPRRERGDGLFTARVTTDAQGAFRVSGLRAGRYAFFCTSPTLVLGPSGAVFDTGNADVSLSLDAHRLLVAVHDRSGRALRGAIVSCARVEIGDDGNADPQAETHAVTSGNDAVAAFEIEPDTTYAVIAQAPGSRRAEELVVVAPGERHKRVELVLDPLGDNGWLRVTVLGARGEVLNDLEVLLRMPVTHQRLRDFGWLSTDADGWLPPIPAGSYGLEVGFRASRAHPPMHFPVVADQPALVRAGERSEITLRARAGGRLMVRLDTDAPIARTQSDIERAQELSAEAAEDLRLAEHGAEVMLIAAGSDAGRNVQFVRPAASDAEAYAVQSRLLPGTSALVDDLLEPGVYVLRVRAPHFRALDTPVEIVAGLQREVRVSLVPE